MPAEATQVAETPKSTKSKTPKGSKRKGKRNSQIRNDVSLDIISFLIHHAAYTNLESVATDDVSPAAIKKPKPVKTPARSKDPEQPAKEEVEPTPKIKKATTTAKVKDTDEVAQKETEKTPATKQKKQKTPSKPQETEKTLISNSKKDNTPEKPEDAEDATLKETEKAPASKSKKEKTAAKAKITKDTPSKGAEQPTSETTEKTPASSKNTPKSTSKAVLKLTQETPASRGKGERASKTPKSTKKSAKKAKPELVEQDDVVEEAKEEVVAPEEAALNFSEEELDEQTKALVQAIDSGDEDGPGAGVVLFAQGQDVGEIPEVSKKEKQAAKKALAALKEKEDTGVIYIGRLPHGFYEHEMKSYFSQFGPIRNIRVSRNKQTGKAKHFGFIEFDELSTAEIVAKTMDNYLLFGHILKCGVIPKAQVNDDLFKGANKRFKVCHPSQCHCYEACTYARVKAVPWNKMESKHIERPMLEDKWMRKINKENKRRAERAKQLQSLGYEFSAPEAKGVDAAKALTAQDTAEEAITEAIEEPMEKAAIEQPPASEAAEGEDGVKEQESTPQPVKRGRGRPAKTLQNKTTETPRKTSRRTKA